LLGHAGEGVLETTVAAMRHALAHQDGDPALLAWLGPCIGPAAFEVGPEVKAAFEAASPEAARSFAPHAPGKWLADLPGLARQRLQALGLASIHGNDGSAAWCTVTNASRFFSHRRDRVSGRMAACIWRSV
jgi:copper oxidase (laccase) domain-containing protein